MNLFILTRINNWEKSVGIQREEERCIWTTCHFSPKLLKYPTPPHQVYGEEGGGVAGRGDKKYS